MLNEVVIYIHMYYSALEDCVRAKIYFAKIYWFCIFIWGHHCVYIMGVCGYFLPLMVCGGGSLGNIKGSRWRTGSFISSSIRFYFTIFCQLLVGPCLLFVTINSLNRSWTFCIFGRITDVPQQLKFERQLHLIGTTAVCPKWVWASYSIWPCNH